MPHELSQTPRDALAGRVVQVDEYLELVLGELVADRPGAAAAAMVHLERARVALEALGRLL